MRAQAQARRDRAWSERLAGISAASTLRLDADPADLETAYLRQAAKFLTETGARGIDPDAAAWRQWDQLTGIALLSVAADAAAILTRWSPAAVYSTADIQSQTDVDLSLGPIDRGYGENALLEWRKTQAARPTPEASPRRRPKWGP